VRVFFSFFGAALRAVSAAGRGLLRPEPQNKFLIKGFRSEIDAFIAGCRPRALGDQLAHLLLGDLPQKRHFR